MDTVHKMHLPQTLMSQYTNSGIFHDTRKEDIFNLIELLQTSNDIHLQIKLTSVLGAYIMSNGTYTEVIITNKSVYYKILDILNSRQSLYTDKILNFLTVLLTNDNVSNQNRKSLTLFARNMIRVCGCLATMSDMFVSCMMYQDTWVALCHCLAEACRRCRVNQNYCGFLVPICIKKCNADNLEVLFVLESLLQDHDSNIKLFLRNEGGSIFTQSMLQHDACMQLLNTVVQNAEAVATLRNSKIIDYLQYYIKCYGPNSQIGQWSMVILYRMKSRDKETLSTNKSVVKNNHEVSKFHKVSLVQDQDDVNLTDTTHLFQNIINEIGNWKASKEFCFKKPFTLNKQHSANHNFTAGNCKSLLNDNILTSATKGRPLQESKVYRNDLRTNLGLCNTDLSFSTIINEMENVIEKNNIDLENFKRDRNYNVHKHLDVDTRDAYSEVVRHHKVNVSNQSSDEGNHFEPVFTSTPNKSPTFEHHRTTCKNINKTKKHKSRKQKKVQEIVKNEVNKNSSFSSRFMSVINDSCTTIVKSVKNIFRTKDKAKQQSPESISSPENVDYSLCSNSFMQYMKKRDTALLNENTCTTQNTFLEDLSKDSFCTTCDDTRVLKNKLTKDKHLEETIRKLKLGINLYGCDFKKISRILFKKERYMTPKILYSVYRKLIVK